MLRIVLFLATNLAILVLLGIVMTVFGIDSRGTSGLLMIALVFGMGASFISLALSKWIAKKSTGAQVIVTPNTPTETLRRLQTQKEPSQLPDQVAAFSIGPSKVRMAGLLRSDPPLENSIIALQKL